MGPLEFPGGRISSCILLFDRLELKTEFRVGWRKMDAKIALHHKARGKRGRVLA